MNLNIIMPIIFLVILFAVVYYFDWKIKQIKNRMKANVMLVVPKLVKKGSDNSPEGDKKAKDDSRKLIKELLNLGDGESDEKCRQQVNKICQNWNQTTTNHKTHDTDPPYSSELLCARDKYQSQCGIL